MGAAGGDAGSFGGDDAHLPWRQADLQRPRTARFLCGEVGGTATLGTGRSGLGGCSPGPRGREAYNLPVLAGVADRPAEGADVVRGPGHGVAAALSWTPDGLIICAARCRRPLRPDDRFVC